MKTIKIGAPYFMCIDEESQKLYSIGHRTSVIDMNSATANAPYGHYYKIKEIAYES